MADNDSAIEETVRTYLASHGGSVEDPSGRGLTDEMARAIGVERPFTLTAVLRQMEGNGVITRDVRGLLTYRIALVAGNDPGAASPATATESRKNGAARMAATTTEAPTGLVGSDAETVAPTDAAPVVATPIAAGPEVAELSTVPVLVAPASETAGTGPAVAGSGADATDETQAPADDKPVSLRDALARRGLSPKGPSTADPASAEPAMTPSVDTTAELPLSSPAPPSPDATATLPGAAPAPSPADTTLSEPAAAPAAVADSESPSAPPPAPPFGGPARAVSLREALAAKAASAPPEADAATAAPTADTATAGPTAGAPAEAPGGPSGAPRFGSGTVTPSGSSPPAGGYFVSLRDSATAPPPPLTDLGPTGGAAAATTTVADASTRAGAGRGARLRSRLDNPVQEVKAPPSKSTMTAVAVALAGLVLIAIISAVVSRTTNHPSPNNSFSASTDACHVVTAADATAVLGASAGQPHFVLGTCVYDSGSSELIVAVFRQQARAMFDAARSSSAQDVSGVGDAAYYVDGRLRVLKGTKLLELTQSPIPQSAPTPVMLALASAALSRL